LKREIIIWPDSALVKKCAPIEEIDDGVRRMLDDMVETMLHFKGAGLAAPQLGYPVRAVVVKVTETESGKESVLRLVNPRLVEKRSAPVPFMEGCLSLPEVRIPTMRHPWVKVEALDENGGKVDVEGDGLLAIALQHELEHLDGRLMVDQLSFIKRSMLEKKFRKAKAKGMRYVVPRPAPFVAFEPAKEK